MLPNEVFALACRAHYEEQGLIVDKTNGEFAHCPLPKGMGETGYYLLWEHHQQQGLLQSRDVGRCCFFSGDAKKWLLTADYFPDNYFELWDIYDEFVTRPRPDHMEKMRRKRSPDSHREGGRKRSANMKKNLSLLPMHARRQRVSAAVESTQKRIEITFPNGKVGIFPSTSFAAAFLGTDQSKVAGWARKGRKPARGFKGYSARYV